MVNVSLISFFTLVATSVTGFSVRRNKSSRNFAFCLFSFSKICSVLAV